MGKKRLVVLAAAISGALVLSACGGSDKSSGSESSDGGEGMKLGLIQEARPEVEPWSASWHDSVQAVIDDNPGTTVTETFDAYDATRAEPVIRQMLDDGANVMLMSTFVLADAAMSVAADYPDIPMIVTAFGVTQKPNLNAGTASYLEIGYSTCWLLAKQSPDGRIGVVGAQEAPFEVEIRKGCELGAAAANPDYKITTLSTNSFTDVQASREQVQTLLDQGIEQIYLLSGTEDAVGGLRLCEEEKAQCATWGGDAAQWAPNGTLLTVGLDWQSVIEELMDQAENGLKDPTTFNLTYGSKGLMALNYADNPAVSDEVQAEFEQVLADLASEEIELPDSEAHPGLR